MNQVVSKPRVLPKFLLHPKGFPDLLVIVQDDLELPSGLVLHAHAPFAYPHFHFVL